MGRGDLFERIAATPERVSIASTHTLGGGGCVDKSAARPMLRQCVGRACLGARSSNCSATPWHAWGTVALCSGSIACVAFPSAAAWRRRRRASAAAQSDAADRRAAAEGMQRGVSERCALLQHGVARSHSAATARGLDSALRRRLLFCPAVTQACRSSTRERAKAERRTIRVHAVC